MLNYGDMPNILTLEICEVDMPGCVPRQPFLCPIARKVTKIVGKHDGITRKACVINGVHYDPGDDAIAFMDSFDAGAELNLPRIVTFTRKVVKSRLEIT